MTVRVSHTVTAQFGTSSTLAELEEFIAAVHAAGLGAGSTVRIEKYNGDQRDPGYTTLTASAR